LLQFRQPFIDKISPQLVPVGAPITISGRNFSTSKTQLNFGLTPLVDPATLADTWIVTTPPGGLPAGVNTVQVVQQVAFGTSADPHEGFESNVAPFVLVPQITTPQPLTVQRGKTLTLMISPPVGRAQRASLALGGHLILIPTRPASGPATTTSLDFQVPADFPIGDFTVRVQIDGAQSPLEIDHNPGSPTFGQLTGNPKVTVTV